ncbi:MAG: hypothetical protein LBB74_06880 [Chitinispirillales bacterium]|jgi:hypothetical protein|nr:hypothetical protein [Chitinispirillales bacterium]
MIPKTIHYCWLSKDPIPEKMRRCMDSWKEKLQGYEFMLWNFDRFDINGSIWVKQAFEAKKYAFAADFIRLYAVYHHGGIYLDMDMEIVKPFDDLLDAEYFMGYESDFSRFIEAGCFGAEKHSPIIENCLNYYDNREFITSNGRYDTLILPRIMREACDKNVTGLHFYPHDYFTAKSFKTGKVNITGNTYCVHHFASGWLPPALSAAYKIRRKIFSLVGDGIVFKAVDFGDSLLAKVYRFLRRIKI